jgi:hypothetical protein
VLEKIGLYVSFLLAPCVVFAAPAQWTTVDTRHGYKADVDVASIKKDNETIHFDFRVFLPTKLRTEMISSYTEHGTVNCGNRDKIYVDGYTALNENGSKTVQDPLPYVLHLKPGQGYTNLVIGACSLAGFS